MSPNKIVKKNNYKTINPKIKLGKQKLTTLKQKLLSDLILLLWMLPF